MRYMIIILLAFVISVQDQKAEALTLYFNDSNPFGKWRGDVPPGYGSIDIDEIKGVAGKDNGVYFTVKANTDYFLGVAPKWDKFSFNIMPGLTISKDDITVTSGGTWSLKCNQNTSEFGWFDMQEAGNGTNSNPLTDPLEFYIKGAALTVNDFLYKSSDVNKGPDSLSGYFFAAHLRDFTTINGATSAFLGADELPPPPPPVPEPSTFLLFGGGFLAAGFFGRRRMCK